MLREARPRVECLGDAGSSGQQATQGGYAFGMARRNHLATSLPPRLLHTHGAGYHVGGTLRPQSLWLPLRWLAWLCMGVGDTEL